MIAISLQSGSNGNCIYVETNDKTLLFDAGICGSEAERRLAAYGRDIRTVDAVIISHNHADHVRYAGVYQRKYGLPLYITARTLYCAERDNMLGRLNNVNYFTAGGHLRFGSVTVQTLPTPHDAVDGAAFVVSYEGKRLGILTDLGHSFRELHTVISSLDAVFIESNYDPEMLARGQYSASLKKRIQGPKGHLSNRESAELVREGTNLQWACLAHLSENNNTVSVALQTHREIVGTQLPFHIAGRHSSSAILEI